MPTSTYALIYILVCTLMGCLRREGAYKPVVALTPDKPHKIIVSENWHIQKAYLQSRLSYGYTTADSLSIILEYVASLADGGMEAYSNTETWRTYPISKKHSMCVQDSVKLRCGSTAHLMIDVVYALTPWQAFAYSHGTPSSDTGHITTLVYANGKLIHADPSFGYLVYDLGADTLLSFYNELSLLKKGMHEKIKRKTVSFESEMLVCNEGLINDSMVNEIYKRIGPDDWRTRKQLVFKSTGICPYKVKTNMTLEKWIKLEGGGLPYVQWLNAKGYPSIDYLVLFPLSYSVNNGRHNEFAQKAFEKISLIANEHTTY